MLAIQSRPKGEPPIQCTPNVLPCKIHHEGPVNASERYWSPAKGEEKHLESFFRGRKMLGKQVTIPDEYQGLVLQNSGKSLQSSNDTAKDRLSHEEDTLDSKEEPVKVLEAKATFTGIVVWDHEAMPDESSDVYVKGVEEWIAFAEQMHSYPTESQQTKR